MSFGILFVLMLGLLILGPRQLHALLGRVARAKAQFEQASRGLQAQFAEELDDAHQVDRTKIARMNQVGTTEPSTD